MVDVQDSRMTDDIEVDDRVMVVSSDGHASAEMPDYRAYMPARYHEEFDAFCEVYKEKGSRNFERANMLKRTDPEVIDVWERNVIETDRVRGYADPDRRFKEMEREGIAAEVLFPDFGLPFELYSPFLAASLGFQRTEEQVDVANAAYNRWLVDFCAAAPHRFAGMTALSFRDVEATLREITWAKEHGLKGVVLPMFSDEHPIFAAAYDPIWSLLEELEMPINSHIAISGITEHVPKIPELPHPACALTLFGPQLMFFCHQIFGHLIWGGVLERHPDLQVVLTEQGSSWLVGELTAMDYRFEGSYLRHDIREVVKRPPSEYFARQCHIGSSLFSLAEMEHRQQIGVDKICLGMDYPHFEGTWGAGPGTLDYLRATLGAARVPPDEARRMLGSNAAALWGFDVATLMPIAERIGPSLRALLTPPTEEHFPRGDVHKPMSLDFA